MIGHVPHLDFAPKGRDEEGLAFTMAWLRHHDRYDADYKVDPKRQYSRRRAEAGENQGMLRGACQ